MNRLPVVMDMQKDSVDGALGSLEVQTIVPYVLDKIKAYQGAEDKVVLILDTHFDDYMDTMEGRKLPVVHCVKETPGQELMPELRRIPGTRFEKHTLGGGELADRATGGQYDPVELMDLYMDIYAIPNAMLLEAAAPDTSVQVDGACYAGATSQSHHNALSAMGMYHIGIVQT